MRFLAVLFFVLLANEAFSDECLSRFTKYDVCAAARKMQEEIAPSLPLAINSNMVFESALAIGPRFTMLVRWNAKTAKMNELLAASNMTKDDLTKKIQAQTRAMVCGQQAIAAFVRLGGSVQYSYKTLDGEPVATVVIDKCV